MNKNLFRIIFNKRRGQLMAVAETSTSQGKAANGEDVPLSLAANTAALATLSFAVLCALGAVLWALPAPQAHAQVVAYRLAPGNQQPTILQTANGVPQVNIQTPSAAGVSRNVYSQFDVQNNGVILNNSRTSTATQLGGWVQGNPWLARGSARVILNEVNSSNSSYLNGYVEVAGQKAEVVIANPSGISVNGGGFINASKTTLTTGTPVLSGGNLDGYRVQGGSITVNGHGLDLSSTDYAAILARAVQVNAGVWANELKVVTGANQIDASSLGANTTPVTTAIAGTGAVPSFALDVAQIGGMYAGKIHLIGTEQGLGVRSAGTVGSTGGDLVLQNNGWLMNTGTLQAKGDLHISIQGDIHNSGTLYASNNQVTDATGTVTNSHQIQAGNILSLSAGHIDNVVTGEMLATTNQLKATHTLTNRGLIDGADTQVDGGIVNNIGTGRIYGDHLSIAAARLINDTETVNGVTSAATLAARDRLDLGISDTFTNREHALIYSGTDMAIGGALDSNRQATGQADTVNNNSATIEAGGNLTIASAALNNRNMHLTTELEVKSIEPVVEYQGSGSANRYLAGTTGVYTFTDESLHLHTPEGNHEAWSSYDVTRTISETTIKTSDPSKILAGGNISLFGDSVYNDNSHIIAGNALNANVRTLNNTQLIGDHVVHDTGTATSYWRNRQKGTDSTGSSSATYNPADVVTSINLTVTRYLPNTTPVGTGTQMTALNNSSLYKTNPASNPRYLLETDPRFTNQKQWLGSDYITQYLPLDPNVTQKRLGDGFYEQRLIREQVAQLTGRRFLAYYTSDEQEYKALMTSAITFGQTYNLRTGIALTPQQMAQLTSDIVWLVEQTIKRTGDNAQGIGKIFDADKVRQEIQAQTKITQEFSKQASTAVASYSTTQKQTLQDQIKKASDADKPALKQQLDQVILEEKVLNILVGAVTGFGQTMVTKESLKEAAEQMRTAMIADSTTFKGVVDSTGKVVLSNGSGTSEGINGDGFKLGGTRVDLDKLCGVSNERCDVPKKPDGSVDTSKPIVFTGGRNDDGTPKQTLGQFLDSPQGKDMAGLAGGVQGAVGTLFGTPYEAGSWRDKLVEAFAGSHDVIGGVWSGLYDKQGNAERGRSDLVKGAQDTWSATGAIVVASPFAAAQSLPPEVWKAIGILLKGGM